jgi:hypothetical protein
MRGMNSSDKVFVLVLGMFLLYLVVIAPIESHS